VLGNLAAWFDELVKHFWQDNLAVFIDEVVVALVDMAG
jgi:hypothetical protein